MLQLKKSYNRWRIYPLEAGAKYITFKFSNYYSNGSFEYYNRTSNQDKIIGSTVEFKKDGTAVKIFTFTKAENKITLTPNKSSEFNEVVITFSGTTQNFREIRILAHKK
jgi:hypothetical protein